ncbi:hypothetical protein HDF26_003103 [Pedobacter cryoconitis]|uniref:outer membrane beta-barrel protein n=1 Tax=Pedobacter cryoconitis TaxID=188932 RepID=UPI00160D816A|nr:outer membrane beta-barrel protein [Pedobacter cryoconitis]MBB6272646.1 hypothetical protein [Pedobacter cryoconitis]
MKRIVLFFIALTAISANSMAQTEKGKVLLGGYLDFSTQKLNSEPKSRVNFGINPTAGFFISNNLVIGAGLRYMHSSYPQSEINPLTNKSNDYVQKSNGIALSPFGRYYIGITPQLKFFGQLQASAEWTKFKADVPENTVIDYSNMKSNFYSASLSPGLAIFPSKRIGIELSLSGFSYSDQKFKHKGEKFSENRNFSLSSDFFNPRLGMQFYL